MLMIFYKKNEKEIFDKENPYWAHYFKGRVDNTKNEKSDNIKFKDATDELVNKIS